MAYVEDEITLPRLSAPSLNDAARARRGEERDGEERDEDRGEKGDTESKDAESKDDLDEAQRRWLVQLELEPEQIVPLYRLGLARGAVVWRDGMEEWRPLLIMREIRQLLKERTRRARHRLNSLANLDARPPGHEPVLALTTTKTKSSPPPAPSSKSPLPGPRPDESSAPSSRSEKAAESSSRPERAPLEARIVLAPKTAPSRRASTRDNDLALLAELSQRRPRQHSVRFKEVGRPSAPPPPVANASAEAQGGPPSSRSPASTRPVVVRQVVPAPTKWASPTLVAATAVGAVLLTALFFWFGPMRTARSAAEQAEKVVMLLVPASGSASTAPRSEPPAPSPAPAPAAAAESEASSQQLAATIPVMSLSELEARGEGRGGGRGARGDGDERASFGARSGGGGRASTGPDKRAIASALAGAAERAASCANGASGSARAVVTFGNSGAVRSVSFESQLPSGVNRSCVYNAISRTRIRPFEGDEITVRKTIRF